MSGKVLEKQVGLEILLWPFWESKVCHSYLTFYGQGNLSLSSMAIEKFLNMSVSHSVERLFKEKPKKNMDGSVQTYFQCLKSNSKCRHFRNIFKNNEKYIKATSIEYCCQRN